MPIFKGWLLKTPVKTDMELPFTIAQPFMSRLGAAVLATVCAWLAATIGIAHGAEPKPESVAVANAIRSVVVILDWDQVLKQGQIGSGILVQRDRVMTQCRIIWKVRHLGVKQRGTRARARLAHEDRTHDLCELEILAPGHFDPPPQQLRSVQEIAVGEPLYVFRAALDETVFIKGSVSGVRTHGKDTTIHISSRLTPAYGGGPWFDSSGALVGITIFRARGDEDASFAYPAEYIFDAKQKAAHQTGQSIPPQSGATGKVTSSPVPETKVEQNQEQKVAGVVLEREGQLALNDVQATEARRRYLAQILAASMNHLIYPKEVLEAGWSGTSTIRFWLEPGGYLRECVVENSSGYAALDVTALLAVRRAIAETVLPGLVRDRGFRGVVLIRNVEPREPPRSE